MSVANEFKMSEVSGGFNRFHGQSHRALAACTPDHIHEAFSHVLDKTGSQRNVMLAPPTAEVGYRSGDARALRFCVHGIVATGRVS
jgi:hypothetical protein